MIITRTPLRICLGGGGTDIKEYYSRYGGFLVSATVNQYIYVAIHKHFEKNIRLCYSRREIVQSSDEVRHPVVHEAMKLFEVKEGGFEIISFADIPSDTGLGTSSSFTVGLVAALAAYQGIKMTRYELAEMACHIEREILGEAGGKQDQYIAAFGGISCLIFEPTGKVLVTPLQISHSSVEKLEENILIFYTGLRRNSPAVQEALIEGVRSRRETLESLHEIRRLGLQTEEILRQGLIDQYGEVLNTHWEHKKRLSGQVSNSGINELYEKAQDRGVLGGKLIGAGGGGYLLLYCPTPVVRDAVRLLMAEEALEELNYRFDFGGSTVLVDDGVDQKLFKRPEGVGKW
jgi:D-glycero-alpha-D-manno-heptose-7-phosphate kinase